MHPPGADTVVVRYGELGVKSAQVQSEMESRLVATLRAALEARDVDATVERRWTRPLIRVDETAIDAATRAAADTMGVVSASPAASVPPDLDRITDRLAATAEAHLGREAFAVDARRAGDDHPFTSRDVLVAGGDAIGEAVPDAWVDLDDPDHRFSVEVRTEEAFVYVDTREGPGGLPLGSQAPLVALVSGGIDSPVAAFEVMRRGSPVVPVYADLGDYGGPDHEARAVETIRTLAGYAPGEDVEWYRLDFGDLAADLAAGMEQGRMLAFHRALYAAAERVAERVGASGIVTGEAIGQKSSQTARNLGVTGQAIDLPVHRPLLTADKSTIEQRARHVGTFHDSTIPVGCQRLVPDQPETNARADWLDRTAPDDLVERARAIADRADPEPVAPAIPPRGED